MQSDFEHFSSSSNGCYGNCYINNDGDNNNPHQCLHVDDVVWAWHAWLCFLTKHYFSHFPRQNYLKFTTNFNFAVQNTRRMCFAHAYRHFVDGASSSKENKAKKFFARFAHFGVARVGKAKVYEQIYCSPTL